MEFLPTEALGRQLLSFVPSLGISLLISSRINLPFRYLLGTRCYFPAEHVPRGMQGRALKSKRSHKKTDEGEDLPLAIANVTKGDLEKMESYKQFHTLVFFLTLTLISFAACEFVDSYGDGLDFLPLGMALLCALVGTWLMIGVDLFSRLTYPTDRAAAGIVFIAALGLSLATLTLLPNGLLAGMDSEEIAASTDALLTGIVRASSADPEAVAEAELPLLWVQLWLANFAAAASLALFAPAKRLVQAYWLTCNLPEPAAAYGSNGGRLLTQLGLGLQLLVPSLAALLWIKPLTDGLGLSRLDLALAQILVLLASASLQMATVRVAVQRYADSSLTTWQQLKAAGGASKKDQVARLLRLKCELVYKLLGKAAVQSIGPAAIFLPLALAHLFAALHPGMSVVEGVDANELLRSVAGFVAWWAGLSWLVFCSLAWAFSRRGSLTD